MRRNSILNGLDDIQDEIRETVDCRSDMANESFLKDIKRCVSSA